LKWASDLFSHEWERAKPWYPYMKGVGSIPDK